MCVKYAQIFRDVITPFYSLKSRGHRVNKGVVIIALSYFGPFNCCNTTLFLRAANALQGRAKAELMMPPDEINRIWITIETYNNADSYTN